MTILAHSDYFGNQRRAGEAERERLVAKAIKRRKRYGFPLIPREIALDAITYAENGTNYLEFMCAQAGVAWPGPALAPFLAEVERPVGLSLPTPFHALPTPCRRPSNGVCVPTPAPHRRWNRPPVGRRAQRPMRESLPRPARSPMTDPVQGRGGQELSTRAEAENG
jgi:hypothetical protein